MAVVVGPLLYARPSSNDPGRWHFDLQLTVDHVADIDSPHLTVHSPSQEVSVTPPRLVADFRHVNGWTVWRWSFSAARHHEERSIEYQVTGDRLDKPISVTGVAVPAAGQLPRAAMFSCSGFAHAQDRRHVEQPDLLWRVMSDRHEKGLSERSDRDDPTGLHLLIGAGDQVYCDELSSLLALDKMSGRQRDRLRRSDDFGRKIGSEYLVQYRDVWNRIPAIATMLARVPGVFTWDDHDILDGWGSLPDRIQKHPRYQQAFEAARAAFVALQLGGDPTAKTAPLVHQLATEREGGDHFLQWLSFREPDRWLDVVLLDTRSHRTRQRVLSDEQWRSLRARIEHYVEEATGAGDGVARHLCVVSPIPVVYLRFAAASWLLDRLPGAQGMEDDLVDQWEHGNHAGERARLIMSLLDLHKRSGAQVTILSGDVHVAASGRIVSSLPDHRRGTGPEAEQEAVVMQVTSSAIVNTPPSRSEIFAIEAVGTEGREHVANGVFTELLEVDPGRTRVSLRNFVTIGFDQSHTSGDRARMWVEWVVEDGRKRKQLVVYP